MTRRDPAFRSAPAARTYRALLRLAPPDLRTRHAAEMSRLFEEMLARAQRRGRAAVALCWVRAAADLVGAWGREPGIRRRRRGRVGIPPRGHTMMMGSDIRYAWRSVVRQRLASTLVIGMLALGIAANVAVFSLVNGIFLRPFPFDEPERLVSFNEKAPKWNLEVVGINFPDFDQWRKSQQLFDAIALWDVKSLNLADGSGAERIQAATVTYEFAKVLRLAPVLGRMFTADEDRAKGPRVAVIGNGLWRERFGADANVIGRTLKLSGETYTIIGVLPREADVYPGNTKLWVPMQGDPDQEGQSYSYAGLGRLKPGVTVQQAEADLIRAHQAVWDAHDKDHIVSPFVKPLREVTSSDFRTAASTLSVAVALLLAVACANVAAVMLARALARRREMGIRVAVGASRLRLLRQLFVENLMLALTGGVLGLVSGQWAIRVLIEQLPDQAPPWASFAVDARVMAFAVAASIVTVLLFGWAPALHAVRGDLRSAMHNMANAAAGSRSGRRTLRMLVGAEFALATLLLVCGGLLLRAYDRVQQVDPGFDPRGVTTFTLSLPSAVYADGPMRLAFWDRLQERLSTLPGVRSAGLVTCPPFGCHWGTFFTVEGQPPRGPNDANPVTLYRYASATYFETMGVRLKRGRVFDDRDGRNRTPDSERVVIVNETFVRTFLPQIPDPLGQRVRTGTRSPWARIIGVVEDVKHYGLERPMRPGVYFPLPQEPVNTMAVALETDGDPAAIMTSARAAVRALDPELPLFNVRTMEQAMGQTLALRTTYSWMLAVFAMMALALALGGTYGVSSYLVTQRTREIGIRVALGARRQDIARAVIRGSLVVVSTGIVVGVAASVGVARLLERLLFGVKPTDGVILSSAIGVLLAAALLANLLPARRAARVDPATSLRSE